MTGQNLNLLCFDGGGVRSLSSLYILQRLMLAKNPTNPPKPCEYFDMIGGTGTGGIIAIMLGRLRMSVDECIAVYIQLASQVFPKMNTCPPTLGGKIKAKYSSKDLQTVLKNVIRRRSLDPDALLKDTSPNACKVFVCATSTSVAQTFLLRSYAPIRETPELYYTAKIWEAARATSASLTFFDPIAIGPLGEKFVDGGIGANNPVRQLWNEAADVFCSGSGVQLARVVRTVVSIGTGVTDLCPFGDDSPSIGKTLFSMCMETENTATEFHRSHSDLANDGRYYRFNTGRGITKGDYDADRIKDFTNAYLDDQQVLKAVTRCSRTLD